SRRGPRGEGARQARRNAIPHRRSDRPQARPAARGAPVKRLGGLISGRGANFEAIAENINAGRLATEIAVVISNRPDARGIEIAKGSGLNVGWLPTRGVAR